MIPDEPVIGYCLKCREKREIASARAVFLGDASRPATQGLCSVCETKITRFGRTPAHEGLDPATHTIASKSARRRRASGPRLVIVESPAKARTVSRFLGRGYAVEASVGHIRDLPANRMGVDIEHDFQPRYVIPAKKKEVVKKLRARARQASAVYLATDPDREGEAIAWHLQAALARQLRGIPVHRVEFHEITQEAIGHAFAHPREIDRRRVDAQQARRILDRVVGYTLSPLLREKMSRKGLSAGRVQSAALRLVCEREREIQAFAPVEYWSIEAELQKQEARSKSFWARLVKARGEEADLKTGAEAQAIVDDLEGAVYLVQKVTRRERKRNPAPPFTTSTMQQEASRKLRFTAKRTMAVAQALYAGKDIGGGERVGLITYMRTDSVNVAASAQAEARQFIREQFGPAYLPAHPPRYKTRTKSAQEAHEAIRPTGVLRTPASLKPYLKRDELRLYTLVWKRFVASQMAPAVLDQTSVDILAGRPAQQAGRPIQQAGLPRPAQEGGAIGGVGAAAQDLPYLFRASGSVVKFPGFLKVYEEATDEKATDQKDVRLPPLTHGELLDLRQLLAKQHFTQPPPRYSDASLIRALEQYGIGRPSTYAPTLSTLLQRHYVVREQKKLQPTELGFIVNDLLVAHFADIINVGFTAEMEEKLDKVATGEQAWVPMLREFYVPFARLVEEARANMPQVDLQPEPTGEMCPQCGQPLVVRLGRYGKFIGCSGWPQCRYTQPLPLPGVVCPQCGGAVVEKRTKKGRKFYGCLHYPACEWATWRKPGPTGG